MTNQNLRVAAKAVLRGKHIASTAYAHAPRQEESSEINYLNPGANKQLEQSSDARLIHESQLLFCIPAMTKWNLKLKTQYYLHWHPKMKYLRI